MTRIVGLLILISQVMAQVPTRAERRAILEYHTQVRENVQPPASNMELINYSIKLERLAMEWAAQCRWEHPDPNYYTQYKGIGQNLALKSGPKQSFPQMATIWYNEVFNYTYHSRRCSSVCGHYTQMVWATTTEIGCAMQRCDSLRPEWTPPVYLMACQYAPGGNYIGEWPYKAGRPCSECPWKYACARNQCVKVHKRPKPHP
uniref:SCP domain-containing protein n=1 Tax=Mesocestoides corti TaxID=53468 RepID=A0A5K3FBL7_MESCO